MFDMYLLLKFSEKLIKSIMNKNKKEIFIAFNKILALTKKR